MKNKQTDTVKDDYVSKDFDDFIKQWATKKTEVGPAASNGPAAQVGPAAKPESEWKQRGRVEIRRGRKDYHLVKKRNKNGQRKICTACG